MLCVTFSDGSPWQSYLGVHYVQRRTSNLLQINKSYPTVLPVNYSPLLSLLLLSFYCKQFSLSFTSINHLLKLSTVQLRPTLPADPIF